jgi:hypothetical protein
MKLKNNPVKLGKIADKREVAPYGSGMNPPARPKSNWGDAPMKSPLKSNFDAAKVYGTVRKTHHEMPKQPKDLSKGLELNSKMNGYDAVKKTDKYRA